MIITEMALSRKDAMNRALDLSEKFVEHFDKIYNDIDNKAINHWASEMQAWINSVLKIVLKESSKPLSLQQKMDWFFTAGSDSETLFDNVTEAEVYNDFVNLVAISNDVKSALRELGLMEG